MKISLLKIIPMFCSVVFSINVFASVVCEQKLADHFLKLNYNPNETIDSFDYTNPEYKAMGVKMKKAKTKEEFYKLVSESQQFAVCQRYVQ